MKRRNFVAGVGAALGAAACSETPKQAASKGAADTRVRRWNLVSAWPKNFPGLGTGVERLVEWIRRLSGGRLVVKVFAAGELVPAFEVFDAVSRGVAQMGHSAAYYWRGKGAAFHFFTAVPFGMNALEMDAWLYHGGGLELWTEAYAPFDLVPFPAGNTGVQMGGWFNREINGVEDLDGLKMRIPGLGGEVLRRAGGTPVSLPGGELLTAMQTGAIDAAEWVGPYGDLAFGLHKVAKYYYYPGWQELGPTLECIVNRQALAELPDDLREAVRAAARIVNHEMLLEHTARNHEALRTLVNAHNTQLRRFPDALLARLRELAEETLTEALARDPFAARVHRSYRNFHRQVREWHRISEKAYYDLYEL